MKDKGCALSEADNILIVFGIKKEIMIDLMLLSKHPINLKV